MTDRRAVGYRLLGRSFDYLLHLRPAEWPILTIHLLTGTALSLGVGGILAGQGGWRLVVGAVAFIIGLNGGTLALNSAFDRDTGDVAYLRRPPPPPPGLAGFGLGLMVAGLWVSFLLPRGFTAAYAVCFVLSVLYSVPPVRLKAVAGLDWIINMVGFGFLTPYAGWALGGRPFAGSGRIVVLGFAFLFGALYPLTQLYQLEEDRQRGDRTLASVLGVDWSIAIALGLAALAFAGFGFAARTSGWATSRDGLARWGALGAAAFAWAVVLGPWWRGRRTMDAAAHQRGMHRALLAWAITDLAALFAWAR